MNNHIHSKNNKPPISSKTIGICIVLLVAAIIAISVFKVPIKSLLTFGILLACPLLLFIKTRGEHGRTMRGDGHKH